MSHASAPAPDPSPHTWQEVLTLSHAPERVQEFHDIWDASRAGTPAPTRAGLDLRRLAPFMPDVTIMECQGPDRVIYRLMGTSVIARLGADHSGRNMLDFMSDREAARAACGLAGVATIPCAGFAVYTNAYSSGARARAETLMLPLDAGTGRPPFLILSFHSIQETERTDRELEATAIAVTYERGVMFDIGFGLPPEEDLKRIALP